MMMPWNVTRDGYATAPNSVSFPMLGHLPMASQSTKIRFLISALFMEQILFPFGSIVDKILGNLPHPFLPKCRNILPTRRIGESRSGLSIFPHVIRKCDDLFSLEISCALMKRFHERQR